MNYNSYAKKHIIKTFSSDQRMRSVNNKTASRYTIDFPESIRNIIGIKLLNSYIPRSEYTIDTHNDRIDYEKIKFLSSNSYVSQGISTIQIPHGNYTIEELITELNKDENLIFQVIDSKTEKIIIGLQQTQNANFNGFKFLFGSGPNNHRSSARILGFEVGVDTDFSTFPNEFEGILSKESSEIYTLNSSVGIDDIIENKNAIDLGIVTDVNTFTNQMFLELTNYEHSFFIKLLQNNLRKVKINVNKTYSQFLYQQEGFINALLLKTPNKNYVYNFQNNTPTSILLIKYKNLPYLNVVDEVHDNYYVLNSLHVLSEVNLDIYQNENVTIDYELNENSFYSYNLDKSSIFFYEYNNSEYCFFPSYINENSYTIIRFSSNENIKETVNTPFVINSNKVNSIYANIEFKFTKSPLIINEKYFYNGNIYTYNNIQGGVQGDSDYIINYNPEIVYNSSSPSIYSLSFSNSIIVLISQNNSIYVDYNSPINKFSFKLKDDNDAFYWSSDSSFSNSVFSNYATIEYQYDTIYFKKSSTDQVNFFNALYLESNCSIFMNININQNNTYNIEHNDFQFLFTLDFIKTPEYFFHSNNTYITNSTIILNVNSDNYGYSLVFNNTVLNSNIISNNSVFIINYSSLEYGIYQVQLNGAYTNDIFEFEYINNALQVINHYYDFKSDSYILNSFSFPKNTNQIAINNINIIENDIFTFHSFSQSNSPTITINNCIFYFENIYDNNFTIDVDERINDDIKVVSFNINTTYTHPNITEYEIMKDNIVIERRSIENSVYEYTFQNDDKVINLEFIPIYSNILFTEKAIRVTATNLVYKNVVPVLFEENIHLNFSSIKYEYEGNIYYSSQFMKDVQSGQERIYLYVNDNPNCPYNIYYNKVKVYPKTYMFGEQISIQETFENNYNLYNISNRNNKLISKNIIVKPINNIPFEDNYKDCFISTTNSVIISNPNDLTEIKLYKNNILHIKLFKNIDNNEDFDSYYIINKPRNKSIPLTKVVLDVSSSTLHRSFMRFNTKQLLSPYKYDLEKTPIIQIICEKIGNYHVQQPIGFYNFVDNVSISNKVNFPLLSKTSKLELSLKRRNSTLDKKNDEDIYYTWNGMEHTLIVEFECLELKTEYDDIVLS